MEQEDVFTAQGAQGTPLQQISQGRFNQIRLPQSPSVPAYLNENQESHSRRGSEIGVSADVKSKIAFLNGLANYGNGNLNTNSFAIASSPTRSPIKPAFNSPSKSHSRANSTVSVPSNPADLTNMIQTLHAQLEQSRNRERLVAERVESLMEQLQNSHSRSRHEQKESDKEVKAMKKQVHKAELALIRCQQELHEARNEQEGFKVRAEHERQAKEKSRQEAFERARTLAGIVEELEVMKREKEVLLGENEALKAVQESMESLRQREESVTNICDMAVQTEPELIPVPEPKGKEKAREDFLCSNCSMPEDIRLPAVDTEMIEDLRDELEWVRGQLKREQDLVHLMNMQCQFRACPCRLADKAGLRFVHDHAYDRMLKERAVSQGLKRKAEDELPTPKYITFRGSVEQTSRVRATQPTNEQHEQSAEPRTEDLTSAKDTLEDLGELDMSEANDLTLRALPQVEDRISPGGVISLSEAVEIPLPSPRSDDLEPTLLLEDMTQVMVEPEPAATAKHFAFSTSTSSRKPLETEQEPETPVFRQSHSALSANSHDDLFDIRPPRYLPPRPSTVMGLRTIASPIRMVPPSPEHRDALTPATSPPQHRTMQIPLKDSPLKNTVTQRRSNSRPRERSQARSPTPGRNMLETQSPSTETFFPVTPKQKTERHARAPIQLQSSMSVQALGPYSTTTRVPLRDFDDDDGTMPDIGCDQYSKTQPLNIEVRGRQPLQPNDPNTHSYSATLPGTPINREAALAQIRARRDRARSVAMRKQVDEESGRVKTPKSAARRGVLLNRDGMARDISNLSQASAPARF